MGFSRFVADEPMKTHFGLMMDDAATRRSDGGSAGFVLFARFRLRDRYLRS